MAVLRYHAPTFCTEPKIHKKYKKPCLLNFRIKWVYPWYKKKVSEKGRFIHEWAYPRVGLSAEFYGTALKQPIDV